MSRMILAIYILWDDLFQKFGYIHFIPEDEPCKDCASDMVKVYCNIWGGSKHDMLWSGTEHINKISTNSVGKLNVSSQIIEIVPAATSVSFCITLLHI